MEHVDYYMSACIEFICSDWQIRYILIHEESCGLDHNITQQRTEARFAKAFLKRSSNFAAFFVRLPYRLFIRNMMSVAFNMDTCFETSLASIKKLLQTLF